MDKDINDSDLQTSQEGDNGQSLVGKLKKNVSEIISNTPLSKWFRKQNDAASMSSVRRRQEDSEDEEELQEFQPPAKRTKLPNTKEALCLNVSEVLSPISSINNVKKPLYRNFPEPVAGPSGYQTRKMLNSTSIITESVMRSAGREGNTILKNPKVIESRDLAKKDSNSDSEESTSGYSSGRVGSKEIVSQESSKQTSPLENSPKKMRSLFHCSSSSGLFVSDRSLSPTRNSSLSSRMPSFNPSTFGSSSFIDRTLSTKRILNSPFYNGRTIYGGASAYGRSTKRAPQDIQKVLRQSVKIKPVNKGTEKGGIQLGKTARRILDTLEQYSSPVSDAKKIPVAWKKNKTEGSLTKYVGANPYVLRESRSASNRELQVPSVTDLLKMKMDQQKTRLQDSTEAARQIATKSSSILNSETYQIPIQRENDKHTTKIKTKITSVRQRIQIEETVPEVMLNPVSLPIKELPKFDISPPPPAQKSWATSTPANVNISKPVSISKNLESKIVVDVKSPTLSSKEKDKSASPNVSEFKFSDPLVLAEYLIPLKALNNFKFSEPLVKKRRSIHPELDDQENKLDKVKKNNGENLASGPKAADSVLDKFRPKEGTWECSICLIRNQSDKTKCAACENPKPKSKYSAEPSVQSFGQPFTLKPAVDTWECPTCMIRNKEELQKCAACEEKKPDKSVPNGIPKGPSIPPMDLNRPTTVFGLADSLWECPTCHVKETQKLSQNHRCQKSLIGDATSSGAPANTWFKAGTNFAVAANTWECSTCLIRNKEELTKCAACESSRPSPKDQQSPPTLTSNFKKKDDEWDCQVCMVRNKADADKCVCCESANPNTKLSSSSTSPPKIPSFNFGIDKSIATSFTFGIPSDSQKTQNAPKTNAALVFGENRQEPSVKVTEPQSFTFGLPAKDRKEPETKNIAPKSSETTDSLKSTLKFGAEPKTGEGTPNKPTSTFDLEKKTNATEATPVKAAPNFNFGAKPKDTEATTSKATPTFNLGAVAKTPTETTSSKTTPTFSFGSTSKSDGAGQTTTTSTFSFGASKKSDGSEQKTFSFGPNAKESVGANIGKATATPTFTFGSANKTDNKEKEDSNTMKINPLLKPNEKLPEKAAVAPVGFSFGLPKVSNASPVSSTTSSMLNKFSSTDEASHTKRTKSTDSASVPPAKISSFTFKAPTTNGDVVKGLSPFSKPAEESKPVGGFSFSFGGSKTTSTTAANSAAVAPTFGSTVSQADSSKQTVPMFKFASSPKTPKQANGFSFEPWTPAFGTKPSANTAESKPFSFGSSASSTQAAPAASFVGAPAKSSMFSFGGTADPKPASSFSFNAPNLENKSTNQFSSFGSTTPKTQPSFGFNQLPAPSFSFGSSQKTESGFGTGNTTTNPFGAANTKPDSVFGAASTQSSNVNGAFNFGTSATSNQKAGFSFGASSTGNESGTAQGGFSFGSTTMNAGAPSAPGGFNFSSTATSFDANTRPSFNFTGGAGITAFSAPPPQDGAMPARKIKKAIRRSVR